MTHRFLAAALLAALMLPLTAIAADNDMAKTKTYVKDSVITTKVKADLAAQKLSSLVHIDVKTDAAGAVTLTGTATSQEASDRATAITQAVSGVTSVENDIRIVPPK